MISVILKAILIFFIYLIIGAIIGSYGDKKELMPIAVLITFFGMIHAIVYITNKIYRKYIFPREVESLLVKIEGLNNKLFILERENVELREKNKKLINHQKGILKLKTNFGRCRLQLTLLKEENQQLRAENNKQVEKYKSLIDRISRDRNRQALAQRMANQKRKGEN
ncbi:hypothetical protein [Thioflexithrix psekupsensis]|uniref:Uncharacterized protein n=1 Tax=Thioflexithrix psekupsensis TaxID=1570016 RepID=A0A251X806_9GAMM|nr:hypothetical protein [Thioflexithrix psekupsensis]OUD14126.1 hypothetical protein TPSD3_07265 [Thioflexithrix psekupsensis]